jgi:predicted RNA-binding Zn-ribbon protein involved in translation (DUF1610 family)
MTTTDRTQQDSNRSRTTCDCGYDLAGLARGTDARCPECGVLLRELKPPRTRHTKNILLIAAALIPSLFSLLFIVFSWTAPLVPFFESASMVAMFAATGWLLLIAVPASAVLAVQKVRDETPLARLIAEVGGNTICLALNMFVSFIAFFLVM